MSKSVFLPYEKTGMLNSLVKDYLNKENSTNSLYEHYPDVEGYKSLLSNPELYRNFDRKALVDELNLQSQLVSNTNQETIANINLLSDNNSYTITTGHQLCLFTGPLFFIYKIATVIKTCEWLKTNFPEKNFIPVYWLASEDHDIEEINHVNIYSQQLKLATDYSGPAGEMPTNDITELILQIKELLGGSESTEHAIKIFEDAYSQKNLGLATRCLVNELFGKYGLVIVDGNSLFFKKQTAKLFQIDCFEDIIENALDKTIHYLKNKKYPIQITNRNGNCFLFENGNRYRIDKNENGFYIQGLNKQFSKDELNKIIESTPEKISPNVVLRPLYQQSILPNISYVGGPGELSYWLEYLEIFKMLGIQFPILHFRQSITLVPAGVKKKIDKVNLDIDEIFENKDVLIKKVLAKHELNVDLTTESEKITSLFNELGSRLENIDTTLKPSVNAEMQKTLNSIKALETKANRAIKKQSENLTGSIEYIHSKIYPSGIMQERHDNFTMYLSFFEKDFVENLLDLIKADNFQHLVLFEN
ncbi:MAG: bacillithiol biosynthesis cysteine-adding enzyme BshC [Bacteroidia bacterium]